MVKAYLGGVNDTGDHQVLIDSSGSVVAEGWVVVCQHLMIRKTKINTPEIQKTFILEQIQKGAIGFILNCRTEQRNPKPTFSTTTLPFTPAFLAINFRG